MSKTRSFANKFKKWRIYAAVLAAIVVGLTTYALIVPAMTLDEDTADTYSGIDAGPESSTDEDDLQDDNTMTVPNTDTENSENTEQTAEITKNSISDSGKQYDVKVTYGENAGIPDEAKLLVEEIADGSEEYEKLLSQTEKAIGAEKTIAFARFFDIKIVDQDGSKVTIQAPVDVQIELADKNDSKEAEKDTQVVHFADGEEKGDVVDEVDVDGSTVSFSAEGFSAYAIVEGPEAIPIGWMKAASLEEIAALGADGLYISHVDGYFMTDNITIINADRTGITKTKPAQAYPYGDAVKYYFEPAGGDNQYKIYCGEGDSKKYVIQANNSAPANNSLNFTNNEADATVFKVEANGENMFRLRGNNDYYWNMQGGEKGASIAAYTGSGDVNAKMCFWYYTDVPGDPYNLDGKTYGLMNWNGGAAGKALMGTSSKVNALDAMALTVLSKPGDGDKLYVSDESDISMWTFHWDNEDNYYLTTVVDGSTKYLKIEGSGVSVVSSQGEASIIKVVPGSGVHSGEISLKSGDATLTYSGTIDNGFTTGGSAGTEWLHFVEESTLTQEYFMTFSAHKISVSDKSLSTGSKLLIYTRVWNDTKKEYEYYAIDKDGNLVRVYESGDNIEWVGNRLNTMLWQFTEYTDDNGNPTYYYELYNEFSDKYIAPQIVDGQVLSDRTIGVNLDGRRNGQYYTSILAWDDPNYTYAGLTVEGDHIASCKSSADMDFFFAIIDDVPVDDEIHTVKTVDNNQYGITMKMKNFSTRKQMSDFLGNDDGGVGTELHQGLLSTALDDDGYPTAKGGSLGQLYSGEAEVNHLFIESTYRATGYYEYDSAQNFASLGKDNNFTVYKELGSYDSGGNKNTLKHGQFFPYNDIQPGLYATVNGKNLYSTTGEILPESDPRKYEHLYLIQNQDCYFAVELEASFVQTPSGLDDWGHDIIYEFTGDDDFWLYVDGELVIDLGGIHSAVPGSVNFRTGEVNVNGTNTTLYDLFHNNYIGRGMSEEAAQQKLNELFEKNDDNQWVFKNNTQHTMKIFYMERGAGASNLHMRFNLASMKPGTVLLNKELGGVNTSETVLAEFPYQIFYKWPGDSAEYPLKNALPDQPDSTTDYVFYSETVNPVEFREQETVGGVSYDDVFMLKPGETAEINFPTRVVGGETQKIESYRIVECGINTDVYQKVYVNNEEISGTVPEGTENRKDYGIDYAPVEGEGCRPTVNYKNEVKPEALRTMTVTKQLYDETGQHTQGHELHNESAKFDFRLYLATEFDGALYENPANMHTYHVKDEQGNYCCWNTSQQTFVKIGEGVKDFSDLTEEQKEDATFHTSPYGSISKIPAFYTVEIRDILAGTQYRLEERPAEIPDGYSFQEYDWDDTKDIKPYIHKRTGTDIDGVDDTVVANKDPNLYVRNLKGWGIRLNKVWSDHAYMSDREATYFAVFLKRGSELTLVPDTLQELAYTDEPADQTLYWYFEHLPFSGTRLEQYEIREVTVDEGGVPVPIEGGDSLTLSGTQKGESGTSQFTYQVSYGEPEMSDDNNVRVETATNERPGIILNKTQWDGETPLAGATFTLKRGENEIGTFTSDEQGHITTAFLSDNVPYTLTETKTPQGYHGLEATMTITLQRDSDDPAIVTVSGVDQKYYALSQASGTESAVLTIKDRPYTFQALKVDADTEEPMQGIAFQLHRQVTVGGVTDFDLNPMPGYENLVTDANGVIPKLDNTLPAGVYELREKATPNGYEALSSYIHFTVSETGDITLGDKNPRGLALDRNDKDTGEGTVSYIMTVPNSKLKKISFMKVDLASPDTALEGAKFDLLKVDGQSEQLLYSGLTSGSDGILVFKDNPEAEGQTVFKLGTGTYHLVETEAPDGYYLRETPVIITISNNNGVFDVTYDDGTSISHQKVEPDDHNVYLLKVTNSSGVELPNSGGPGTTWMYLLGSMLLFASGVAFAVRRRLQRKEF